MYPSLSIVLPCYNESKAIESVLDELFGVMSHWSKEKTFKFVEVVVVDDGSTDGSLDKIECHPLKKQIVRLGKNKGYGNALKEGFNICSGDWIAFYDFDGTCHPKDIELLAKELIQSEDRVILGRRLHNKTKMPHHRQLGNKIFSLLINQMLKSKMVDSCTGFRLFHRKNNKDFQQLPDDLNFSLAMTGQCIRKKIPIHEVPINYTGRLGRSKLNSIYHGLQFLKTSYQYSRDL